MRQRDSVWRGDLLREVEQLQTDARPRPEGIELSVRAKYRRPDVSGQFLEGEYRMLITRAGTVEVSYDYAPVNATGTFLEVGLALRMPATNSEFRWIGQGPFAGYPGKDRLKRIWPLPPDE